MHKIAALTVQKWGNSLAIRIPSTIAKTAHFHRGTPVLITVHKDGIVIKPSGERKLSLAERLMQFNPEKHGGEVMATEPVGREKL